MTMKIYLDSVPKRRGKAEWRPVSRARCGEFEVIGDGQIIMAICREMQAAGVSGDVEVWRGATRCFFAVDLGVWAGGKALTGEQPEHLRK